MPHPSLAPLITLSAISSGAAPILADVLMSETFHLVQRAGFERSDHCQSIYNRDIGTACCYQNLLILLSAFSKQLSELIEFFL